MDIKQLYYWNNRTYGKSIMIHKNIIRLCIILLGIIIPVIIPLPLCVYVCKYIKNNIRLSY